MVETCISTRVLVLEIGSSPAGPSVKQPQGAVHKAAKSQATVDGEEEDETAKHAARRSNSRKRLSACKGYQLTERSEAQRRILFRRREMVHSSFRLACRGDICSSIQGCCCCACRALLIVECPLHVPDTAALS
jgi:hypothetical protein